MKNRCRIFALALLVLNSYVAKATAESPLSISFVAAAFKTQNDFQPNSSLAYLSTKLRLDSYMEGNIFDNGFVSINGNYALVRITDGEIVRHNKLGIGDCSGHFLYDRSATPSSVELVKLKKNIATVRIRTPHLLSGYHDTAAPALCQGPDLGIFAVNPDGSPGPNTTTSNTYTPATYVMDGAEPGTNVGNHYSYAEFPINVDEPSGSTYFSFVHDSVNYANGFPAVTIKMVWFGVVTVKKKTSPSSAENAYTLKGYIAETDPSKPPANPPAGGNGQTVSTSDTRDWLNRGILNLVKNSLKSMQGSLKAGNAGSPAFASTQSTVGGGAVIFDTEANTAQFVSTATAPAGGALAISATFTKVKTGKVTKIKFQSTSAVAGQATLFDTQAAKKLFNLLRSKGAFQVSINASLKAQGLKAIKATKSFKLK